MEQETKTLAQKQMTEVLAKRKLRPEERKMLRLYMSGKAKNLAEAARMAGLSEWYAGSNIYRPHNRQLYQQELRRLMDAKGLDDNSLIGELKRLVKEATTSKWNDNKKDWDEFPDNEARKGGLHMALKLKEAYPSEKVEAAVANFNFVVKGLDDE